MQPYTGSTHYKSKKRGNWKEYSTMGKREKIRRAYIKISVHQRVGTKEVVEYKLKA